MSRIGKRPIPIPEGVKVITEDDVITVEGQKGILQRKIHPGIKVSVEDGKIFVSRSSDQRQLKALHGLTRTLLANMVQGVTEGFKKTLEIVGVGYRAEVKGNILNLTLGYSHPVSFEVPHGVSVHVERQTLITVEGIDKYQVGQVAAKIRDFRKPDSYKGKGIRYTDEKLRRKVGKASTGSR